MGRNAERVEKLTSHLPLQPTRRPATLLQDKDGVPDQDQVLIYGGKLLDDACTLGACGLEAGSTVQQTSRLRGGKPVKVFWW